MLIENLNAMLKRTNVEFNSSLLFKETRQRIVGIIAEKLSFLNLNFKIDIKGYNSNTSVCSRINFIIFDELTHFEKSDISTLVEKIGDDFKYVSIICYENEVMVELNDYKI